MPAPNLQRSLDELYSDLDAMHWTSLSAPVPIEVTHSAMSELLSSIRRTFNDRELALWEAGRSGEVLPRNSYGRPILTEYDVRRLERAAVKRFRDRVNHTDVSFLARGHNLAPLTDVPLRPYDPLS